MKNEEIAEKFKNVFESFYKSKINVSVNGNEMMITSSGRKIIETVAHDIALASAIAKRTVDFEVEYNHAYQLTASFK